LAIPKQKLVVQGGKWPENGSLGEVLREGLDTVRCRAKKGELNGVSKGGIWLFISRGPGRGE